MKKGRNYKEYFEDIKPITDEELMELLNDPPRKRKKNKKDLKKAKKELYRDETI